MFIGFSMLSLGSAWAADCREALPLERVFGGRASWYPVQAEPGTEDWD